MIGNTDADGKDHFFTMMKDDNWGTPQQIIKATKDFFGGSIDLDPGSDAYRNTRLGARKFLGLEDVDPVLGIPAGAKWGDAKTVFINPPGGRHNNITLARIFWRVAVAHVTRVEGELVWFAYNINQMQVLQNEDAAAIEVSHVCVPNKRVRCEDRTGKLMSAPTTPSAILCLSGRADGYDRFRQAFGSMGACWEGS